MLKLSVKTGIWVLILTLLVSLSLLFVSLVAKEQEKEKRILVESELAQFKEVKKTLVLKLDKVKSEKSILSSQQEELEKEAELLEAELEKQSEDKEAVIQRLKENYEELTALKAELEKKSRENSELGSNVKKLQDDYNELKLQLEKTQFFNQELENKIAAFTSTLPRKNRKVEKKEIAKAEEIIYAKVLVVNKEFNFIVLNAGRKQGLEIGEELFVFRDNQNLGKVFIEKIYDFISTATFSSLLRKDIKIGDKIELRAY